MAKHRYPLISSENKIYSTALVMNILDFQQYRNPQLSNIWAIPHGDRKSNQMHDSHVLQGLHHF